MINEKFQENKATKIQIIWNFDSRFNTSIEESIEELDWSQAINMNQKERIGQLSNSKMEQFLKKMKKIKGHQDYDDQVLGLILVDEKVAGVSFLSNIFHYLIGTRLLYLSEISLFDPKNT